LVEMKTSCRSIEKYGVFKFVAKHTHVLASPHMHMFLKSQRTINPKPAVDAELTNSSGITLNQQYTYTLFTLINFMVVLQL